MYTETRKLGINRRVELQIHSEIAEGKFFNSRIKYVDDKVFKILMPLDDEGNPFDIPKGTPVTVYIPDSSAEKHGSATTVLEQESNTTTGEHLLVLAQPEDGRIEKRDYVRIETALPVSLRVEYNDNPCEGTAINLSASGIMLYLRDENDEIPVGARVSMDLNLDGEFFKLNGNVTRKEEQYEGTDNHTLAIKFHIEDSIIQDDIMGYVLVKQIKLKTKNLLDEVEVVHQEQIYLLKDEVARLRRELELAYKRADEAAEAKQRGDAIIRQLTKQLEEQTTQIYELHRWQNKRQRWKFGFFKKVWKHVKSGGYRY